MADAAIMDILNPREQLKVELACLLLAEALAVDDVIEQLTSFAVFHYKV